MRWWEVDCNFCGKFKVRRWHGEKAEAVKGRHIQYHAKMRREHAVSDDPADNDVLVVNVTPVPDPFEDSISNP
jgi:hypothetical protein